MCLGKGSWGGGRGEGGCGGRGGAPAITSVDRLLSVFTQTRGVSQGANILITAPTSWAVSEAEVPGLSGPGRKRRGGGGGRWENEKKNANQKNCKFAACNLTGGGLRKSRKSEPLRFNSLMFD